LILGDSLQVMSSLARREDLAGKVQMIYIDPPYGIKFASNFQPQIGKRDVKDREQDLTREPEMVKAYRDTWHLGIHSYLTYLRDRLIVARDLLADTGSIFVQIGNENLHRVRQLLGEVFGADNQCAVIAFKSTSPLGTEGLPQAYDFIVWFARDKRRMKFRPLFVSRDIEADPEYRYVDGTSDVRGLTRLSHEEFRKLEEWHGVYRRQKLTSSGFTRSCTFDLTLEGKTCYPFGGKSWATNPEGMERLRQAERLFLIGNSPYYKRFYRDAPMIQLDSVWTDQPGAVGRMYVVQTAEKFVQRCLLMTTDPGDLVLDPTCGSGTTAYVAEKWGRRWITIDTSRVAIAIARQRLLTAKYDYYELKNKSTGVAGGFVYKTVPHITLKSIAQNTNLDPIFEKHEPILNEKLEQCNVALSEVSDELRHRTCGWNLAPV